MADLKESVDMVNFCVVYPVIDLLMILVRIILLFVHAMAVHIVQVEVHSHSDTNRQETASS